MHLQYLSENRFVFNLNEFFLHTCTQSEEHHMRTMAAPVFKKTFSLHNQRLKLLEHMVSLK